MTLLLLIGLICSSAIVLMTVMRKVDNSEPLSSEKNVAASPGAEGVGKYTSVDHRGKVLIVTNRNDMLSRTIWDESNSRIYINVIVAK